MSKCVQCKEEVSNKVSMEELDKLIKIIIIAREVEKIVNELREVGLEDE